MKNSISIFCLIILITFAIPLYGQNRLTADLQEFSALSVSGGINVELIPSERHEMSITARNGQPEEVRYEIKNGELSIKVRPDFNQDDEVKVKLPYTGLVRIEATSGSVINSRYDLKGMDLELRAASGGKIELTVEVNSIEAEVTQFADIIVYGKARTQNVSAGTGGNYLAYDLVCDDTFVKATSGAQAKVVARRNIDATAASRGFIGYIGDPSGTYTKTSLGGEIARFRNMTEAESY